jgi:hypothetical protein
VENPTSSDHEGPDPGTAELNSFYFNWQIARPLAEVTTPGSLSSRRAIKPALLS